MALVGDDCFFFLNSGCVRGSQCTFRHQPAARVATIVCPQWLQRCCFKPNCVLRHTDDIVGRNHTPCFYESSTGVCWKSRCAFAHVKKPANVPVPLPPPPPVLPLRPPVLPAMPPVLPVIPPILPATISITAIPPPIPLPTNIPLPNNTPVVRPDPPAVVKTVADVATMNSTTVPPAVVPPLTTPPPGLPSPPKLTEMLLGKKLPPAIKEGIGAPAGQPTPPTTTAAPNQTGSAAVVAAAAAVSPAAKPVAAAFPKSDHFNEQVRRFKEMLASKTLQKKHKNGCSDDEKPAGGIHKVKERQRSKKERREKEGHKSHKSSRSSKDKLSKADEEILYGDYKDVPLDKKHKKKKHKEHKEYADSDPEIKVKSYEQILREKALRKLYSRRKEKFNEDFKELVNAHVITIEDTPDKKTDRVNDGLPDKVIRKSKRYNSDGDELESSDDSHSEEGSYKRKPSRKEDFEKTKGVRKYEEKHNHIKDVDSEFYSKNNDIKDEMLKKAIIDSEKRHKKQSKKHFKKRKHKRGTDTDEAEDDQVVEVRSSGESFADEKPKQESQSDEESGRSTADSTEDSDSDSDSDTAEGTPERKKEEIIIPDETTNIDFSVDLDDELAMEINQTETETSSKSKKLMSCVVVPTNATSDRNKYHKSTEKVASNPRHQKTSDSKSSDRNYTKSSEPKKSSDRDQRRKSPKDCGSTKLEKTEPKKVVRLVNATDQLIAPSRTNPVPTVVKEVATPETKPAVKDIKVKTFVEIMAEKQKRNRVNTLRDPPHVVDICSPISKNIVASLKEKSTRAKLEILDMPKELNGSSVAEDTSAPRSKQLSEEEKHKRKSIPLYKPPQPVKPDSNPVAKTTEIKMVVNTGPRKIIRIRKASLSTDLIDQSSPVDALKESSSNGDEKNDGRETVNVRSFEEIIREKRARQKKERELAQQMEKENAASTETSIASTTNSSVRRKPVIRRQIPPASNAVPSGPTPTLSKTITPNNSTFNNLFTSYSSITTSNNSTDTRVHHNAASEVKRVTHSDTNVAKVSPLNIFPPKRTRSDRSMSPVATPAESLENKDFFSRLRNTAARRSFTSSHTTKGSENTSPSIKTRKRSINAAEASVFVASNHMPNIENVKSSVINSAFTDCSNEAKSEYHGSSRKDIQEALDEERRKREQDLLSDDEFEKEINELGSDDGDDNFDDINEDDLMMELEQMIDS